MEREPKILFLLIQMMSMLKIREQAKRVIHNGQKETTTSLVYKSLPYVQYWDGK